MSDSPTYHSSIFDPAALARLENLTLRARAILGSRAMGEHTSKMRGFSAEFADHRPWEPGDDPKFLDWRVYARTGRRFLKRFTEDANQTYYFLLAKTPGMMRTGELPGEPPLLTKCAYGECLGAMLGFLATRQKDRFGVSVFSRNEMFTREPTTGEAHFFKCLDFLEHIPDETFGKSDTQQKNPPKTQQKWDTKTFLEKTVAGFHRRGVIFLAGDFFDVASFADLLPVLKRVRAERYEVAVFHTLAPDEIAFPFTAATRFVSLENTRLSLTAREGEALRRAYLERFTHWQAEIKTGCENLGIFYQLARTDQPLDQPMTEFLKRF